MSEPLSEAVRKVFSEHGPLARANAFFQPENFIGFILGNRRSAAAARLARLTAPRVKVRIACRAPSGKAAIQIRL